MQLCRDLGWTLPVSEQACDLYLSRRHGRFVPHGCSMSDPHPRYVLRESVGRKIRKRPSPGNPVIREWLILDTWYCYCVVWQFFGWASPSFHGRRIEYGGGIAKRRQRAESELRKLNAAHDAWLADA